MGKSTNLQGLRNSARERTRSNFSSYIYTLTAEKYGLTTRAEIARAFARYLESLAMQATI